MCYGREPCFSGKAVGWGFCGSFGFKHEDNLSVFLRWSVRLNYRAAQMCALCVTQRFCDVSRICLRLKSPFRLSAPYFEGPK
ncbi:hypothetical protein JN853_16975 [Pseudomonas syringae pv. actinidiae ICMP 9853]|uniref:Uncharacterized protein n=1 Tax=Pseudomonas syringae pv. actinidiae TaxID=103796 RepID=A0A2V0QWM1_PSESF|nr:hypothetical protein JN853_16975 [Pseudomonas syringae pv. actinidiae ICMP 9853]AQX59053.1 hypothetical protein B1R35_13515 [Pseudomonas syringae pv. actinidiae]AQX66422.1 hypothetical protein B1F85_22415 [Pseudomonas syringae pv. actinidiae]PBK48048.1 hypothetical protein BUE61_27275 [Pseudomonas syringae pv. actinidiae]PBK49066.1 hypothetical protein BUE60_25210 [Pseudomonas syringae pv. actinidiae]